MVACVGAWQMAALLAAQQEAAAVPRTAQPPVRGAAVNMPPSQQPPNTCGAAIAQQCGLMRGAPDTSSPAECLACAAQHQQALQAAGCTSAAIKTTCSIVQELVPISGLECDGTHAVWTLFAEGGGPKPLVSFAHGLTAWNVTTWFPQLLYGMAARGYTVVASEAGTAWCAQESSDQSHGKRPAEVSAARIP